MFACIVLENSKQKLVIPLKWIYSIDITQIMNYGISHTKQHVVFYCNDPDEEPNFRLPIQNDFDENQNACYYARVLHIFGEFLT